MKLQALAAVSALFLLAACGDGSDSSGANGGAGGAAAGYGTGNGEIAPNVGDRVFFALDSSVLSSEAQAALGRQADWLKSNGSVNVVIEGHCDERGTREYNIALGERRASAAKSFLSSVGVEAGRISTISYGKERPAVVGSDESAYSQNRRAVTVIAN
ncbi:MAG: peptidoglycan-associated lipoprotein [Alphaproteobacteria bacterium]|nr:peptidoglycan-associated lipoprotein [Alphaproteobacteria bacterium]